MKMIKDVDSAFLVFFWGNLEALPPIVDDHKFLFDTANVPLGMDCLVRACECGDFGDGDIDLGAGEVEEGLGAVLRGVGGEAEEVEAVDGVVEDEEVEVGAVGKTGGVGGEESAESGIVEAFAKED